MYWLLISLVPRQVWLLLVAVLAVQLAGFDVIGPLLDVTLDPLIAWIESQISSSLVFW